VPALFARAERRPARCRRPAGRCATPTDLTDEVWFYLRGEEYSAQIDYFAESVRTRRLDGENSFASALETDRVVAMMLGDATARPADDGAGACRQDRLVAPLRMSS
jgi:hypothetical protein